MQNKSLFLISIFFLALIGPWIELTSADNTLSTATELYDGDAQDGYLCNGTCSTGYGPQDQYDWYKVYVQNGEMLHATLYNNGTPAEIYIDMTIFDSSSSSLTSTERVGHLDYGILTHTATYSGYYYIELEAIDSWFGKDDTNYRLSIDIETNNVPAGADQISLGDQFGEYVCARNCDAFNSPILYEDPIDWYKVDIPAFTSWGLSIDKEDTYTYVDLDVYEVGSGGILTSLQATEEGGITDQYSTVWGNTTTAVTYYLRVIASTSNGNYGTEYTLSISSGEWYTVKEDSASDPSAGFSYITINDVRPGETIRAHAIRTETPNDLDVLLYNESEFEIYKEYIRNNSAGTRQIPDELMKKEDCWVCYIELNLDDEDVGLTSVNPGRSANRSTDLSWTPTFYLVADYTDYLQDPPWNYVQDISHVFLSLDVDRGLRTNQYYTVESWDSTLSNWQFVQSGSTTTGSLSAPSGGWDASENESSFLGYTDYRVTVRNASTSGSLVSQSQFRAINLAPVACFDTKGVDNSVATVHVPVTFDATCSSDPDSNYPNQDIVSRKWYVDGSYYGTNGITGFFTETGTIDVALEVEDDQGLVRWKNQTITIVDFPVSNYTSISSISGQSTIRLDTNYTVQETLTWRPNWADAEVANKVVGVGLAFNFQRTHIGYVDVEIDPSVNGQFASLDAEVLSSSDQYILELKPQVQFYWYDVENQSNAGKIGFPVPSLVEEYTGQTNYTIEGTKIYLWDQYVEVYNGTTLVDDYGQAQTIFENITLSSIDLYPIIQYLFTNALPVTGQAFSFLNTFVDIEILLEFGIDLRLTMDNALYMHSTTAGTFYDYDQSSSLIQFTSFQNPAYDNYASSNSNGDVLNTTNITGTTAFSLYPFYQWESDTEVYGFVNLTINISPSKWLTSILSWFMEDPQSLGQSWSYRLFESPTPIAASGNSGYIPITTRYDVLAPNYDGDSQWDGTDTDDDNDGVLDAMDSCSQGALGWTSATLTDHDQDGCRDSTEDMDDDNDGMSDSVDACSKGALSWTSSTLTDYDSDGCQDSTEDTDDDNDGITDSADACSQGALGWTSSSFSDHDSDGCRDSSEDNDDDNDLVADSLDTCPTGATGWTSSSSSDYDGDGCQDASEDSDDDNDNIMDLYDDCQLGTAGWTSSSSTDYDSDGCHDSTEDDDDDDDGVLDSSDNCPQGSLSWISSSTTDYDSDGCQDSTEDMDDDNDNVLDVNDDCTTGALSWTSSSLSDYDTDGCQDSTEDSDDDNDNIADSSDSCQKGVLGWSSSSSNDYDTDGCQDISEDNDDDNDAMIDQYDACQTGSLGWTSSTTTDHDSDGCRDANEDLDDDNDNVLDANDACQTGALGWVTSSDLDYDSDGCRDNIEDDDDDGDSILDTSDACQKGLLGWSSSTSTDYDGDGCSDAIEDLDDDNDNIEDAQDSCQKGVLGWTSTVANDYDADGCQDNSEDLDDDNDNILDASDDCQFGAIGWTNDASSDYDSDGCKDDVEDDDDDGDAILDSVDDCSTGDLGWVSTELTDYDTDGCQDSNEDNDDDNDNVPDTSDACPVGVLSWLLQADYDSDGCRDSDEDLDDDDDGIVDSVDACPTGQLGWFSVGNSNLDFDSDGCRDSDEDDDDDNDGILDSEDSCEKGLMFEEGSKEDDYDLDGCYDVSEDQDDDNDAIEDSLDQCLGQIGWESTVINDYDRDGCRDLDEDFDDDNDGVVDLDDLCPQGYPSWQSSEDTDFDGDGCWDDGEDLDDDNDDVLDANDAFPLDARYFLDTDSDGVADLIDVFPNNGDQSIDSDGDGFGDNSNGENGDGCPEEAHPETPNGCAWTAVEWMQAHPVVSVGSPLAVLALVGLVILYLRKQPTNVASTEDKIPVPLTPISQTPTVPTATQSADMTDQNGYEWIKQQDGSQWYRVAGTGSEWQKFEQQ